jgi:inhibitor of cysteine peptidase
MKTRTRMFLLTAVLVAVMASTAACGSKSSPLTAADNGKSVEVKKGDLIVIQLDGNPSTGYNWEAKDLDSSMFEQVGEPEFKSGNPDPNIVGAGGTLTLTFKALKTGIATLALVYHRSWEPDVEPLDTFSVTITVK